MHPIQLLGIIIATSEIDWLMSLLASTETQACGHAPKSTAADAAANFRKTGEEPLMKVSDEDLGREIAVQGERIITLHAQHLTGIAGIHADMSKVCERQRCTRNSDDTHHTCGHIPGYRIGHADSQVQTF